NILAGGHIKISTGHDKSKFGIPIDQVDKVLAIVKQHNIFVNDLHIHTGSDIKDVDVFVKGIGVLFDVIPHFHELEFIDLGGGFKVPYKEGDGETDINLLAQKVGEAFANHPNPNGKPLQVWFEPGKFFVSACGYFITKVNVIKKTSSATFVSVDSGFNHLIRPMFYDAYHRIENISNPDGEEKKYSVVGNICETDTFAWDRNINEVREGDYLVFYNAGAYGFEMSSNFNSRLRPSEVLVKDGKPQIIRKRETFDDILRNLVIV
ncbi:MAG TPA: diaminopimelate decarboxylase, partial [Puia sp.]|nr:diaminopimelate decarboxylase [Puia sp.]